MHLLNVGTKKRKNPERGDGDRPELAISIAQATQRQNEMAHQFNPGPFGAKRFKHNDGNTGSQQQQEYLNLRQ